MLKPLKPEPSGEKRSAPSIVRCVGARSEDEPRTPPHQSLADPTTATGAAGYEATERSLEVPLGRYRNSPSRDATIIRPTYSETADEIDKDSSSVTRITDCSIIRLPLVMAVPDDSLIVVPSSRADNDTATTHLPAASNGRHGDGRHESIAAVPTPASTGVSKTRFATDNDNTDPTQQAAAAATAGASSARRDSSSSRGGWISSLLPRRRSSSRKSSNSSTGQ
jgi:hypothetical protein